MLKNPFKKKKPLNFDSILIVTYGRSGSTLLMGVLNSIDGVVIRGENYDFCAHLYKGYKALLKTKEMGGKISQNPFYGSEQINVQQLLNDYSKLVKTILLPNQKALSGEGSCYGFKEIRYSNHLAEFEAYLSFLEKIFPKTCFIFNTRNKEDVLKSVEAVGFYKKAFDISHLEKIESTFFDYINNHKKNTFHITYNDVIKKSEKLKGLFDFIGAPYNDKKIDKVLSYRHSYAPTKEEVKKLPYKKTAKFKF